MPGAEKEEFYSAAFRTTFYESPDELQRELDRYATFYNRRASPPGLTAQARTPCLAFLAGVGTVHRHQERSAMRASLAASR